jgi:LPXTG-motif cell wall-anchored protein
MSVLNKRNAILGWGVWQVGKVAAKRKAKQALEPKDKGRGKGAGAVLSGLAAAGGAVWFWRRRRSDNES